MKFLLNKTYLEEKYYKNVEYYKMMEDWHKEHGGVAIEDIVKKLLISHLDNLPSGSQVLEMGCGEGSVIIWLAKRYPHLQFIGTDISPVAIELAKSKSQGISNVIFLVDDIENSNLKNESISFIISQSVLEHLINYKKALEQSYRILSPGGRILIRVGNGGRLGKGIKGFIVDLLRYLLRLNKVVYLNPKFQLNGNKEEKRKQHMTNFDLAEIPSDVLIRDLKRLGYKIRYFTTCKEFSLQSDNYIKGNLIKRKIIELYVKLNIFPFSHMGRTLIVLAEK
jgi:SAM-dependent methyltransferase